MDIIWTETIANPALRSMRVLMGISHNKSARRRERGVTTPRASPTGRTTPGRSAETAPPPRSAPPAETTTCGEKDSRSALRHGGIRLPVRRATNRAAQMTSHFPPRRERPRRVRRRRRRVRLVRAVRARPGARTRAA